MDSGMTLGSYVPKGTKFEANGRQMMLVLTNEPDSSLHGWLLEFKLNRWFTFRKATQRDIDQVSAAVIRAHHSPERERRR